jgi:hypothetical protein
VFSRNISGHTARKFTGRKNDRNSSSTCPPLWMYLKLYDADLAWTVSDWGKIGLFSLSFLSCNTFESTLADLADILAPFFLPFTRSALFVLCPRTRQGCQMVCFQTKNPNLGKFRRVLLWKILVYFMTIWSILRPLEIFCGNLVYFSPFWYFGPRKIWQPWDTGNKKAFRADSYFLM